MTTPTPTEARRAHQPYGPAIVSLSRRGGECIEHGMVTTHAREYDGGYLRERLAETGCASPYLWRSRILSQGVVLSSGHGIACRRVMIRKPAGFPSYVIDPRGGWSRHGTLARPAGHLPA